MNKTKFLELIEPYDNIIFDYGGILYNLDYFKTIDAFTKLVGDDFSNAYSQKAQSNLFDLYETGAITCEDFRKGLRLEYKLSDKVSDQEIDTAWCSMLLDLPTFRVDFIEKLSKKKNIYMLSNINQIHEKHAEKILTEKDLFRIYSYFKKVYFSHHIGMRKPNTEIFEFVCSDAKIDKEKTLFIDDSIQHIESAKRFGLNTYFLKEKNTLLID